MDGALSLPTIQITVEELYEKVKPQLEMFKENGGVTLSGGEALLQFFVLHNALLDGIHKQHTPGAQAGLF